MNRRPVYGGRFVTSAVVLSTALLCPSSSFGNQTPPEDGDAAHAAFIQWAADTNELHGFRVEVHGLNAAALTELASWSRADRARALSVHVEQEGVLQDLMLPPVAGSYVVDRDCFCFKPRFPLEPGVAYRAVFYNGGLPGARGATPILTESTFRLPDVERVPSTVVRAVYPSSSVLPENLLKFYLHFSAPMSRGHVYQHIRLLNETGDPVELPFLELAEELWNPSMTRLTLFIDPGRIKREVRPLEEIGPALEEGSRFTLAIDRSWEDGSGTPLKTSYERQFLVGPPDRDPPDPDRWTVNAPSQRTRAALVIEFDEPMDHALAQRLIRIMDPAGHAIQGSSSLAEHERQWAFVPDAAWEPGPHTVAVQTTIEDLAGNNIGKPFEVDIFEGVQRGLSRQTVSLAFNVE